MKFIRGQDPKKTMGIGLYKEYPEIGDHFFVRYRLRNSGPEYYPLQVLESNNKPAIGICTSEIIGDAGYRWMHCNIIAPGGELLYNFYVNWNFEEHLWEIK